MAVVLKQTVYSAKLKANCRLEAHGSICRDGRNVPEKSYCCISQGNSSPESEFEWLQVLRLWESEEAGFQARLTREAFWGPALLTQNFR